MSHCCICGKEITSENSAVLFYNDRNQPLEVCELCEMKLEALVESKDPVRRKALGEEFYKIADKTQNKDISGYLFELLDTVGYKTPEDEKREKERREVEKAQSNWVSLLRSITWIGVVLMLLFSVVLGVVLGELLGGFVGVVIVLVGIALSFIMPAWTMVLLDAADDLRAIRVYKEKTRNKK